MEQTPSTREKLEFDKLRFPSTRIIHKILVNLPLKYAISTNLLSRYWKDKWRSIPDIVFNKDSFPKNSLWEWPAESEKINIIDNVSRVLLLHRGDIRKFEVTISFEASSELDSWLHFLVGANVKELVLNLSSDAYQYWIPFSIFRYEKLATLNICGCIIRLPSRFNGFRRLTHLFLDDNKFIGQDLIERLTRYCPILTHFSMKDYNGCSTLKILAPNLRSFDIEGPFRHLCFDETAMITSATISLDETLSSISSNVYLSDVEELQLLKFTIEALVHKDSIGFRGYMYNRIKVLHIDWTLDCVKQIDFGLYILRSAPVLENLYISCWFKEENKEDGEEEKNSTNLKKLLEISSFKFKQLRIFEMENFYGTKTELRLIEYVLGNSPLLEEINITLESRVDTGLDFDLHTKFLKEINSFQKASACATIIFC